MSSSIVLCGNLIFFNQKLLFNSFVSSHGSSNFVIQLGSKTRRLNGFISKAEKHSRKRSSWWQKFFLEDDGNWLGLKDDDMESEAEEELSTEDEKFEAWKQRAEAIVELREAQEDRRNEEYREWEDWLLDQEVDNTSTSSWEQGMKDYREKVRADSGDVADSEKGLVESVRYLIFGRENDDDDMLYEDRVFQYASSNSVTTFICSPEIFFFVFIFHSIPGEGALEDQTRVTAEPIPFGWSALTICAQPSGSPEIFNHYIELVLFWQHLNL